MPFYRYKALDDTGRRVDGTMSAADESSLDRALVAARMWVIESRVVPPATAAAVRESRPGGGPNLSAKAKRRALIEFCTMLGFQTKVGVPLVQAIEAVAEHCDDAKFKVVVDGVKDGLESGLQLHEAMGRYHRTFSTQFIGIVRAGEMSGNLTTAFHELKRYLTWVDRLIADVKQASLYPAIVTTVICLFVLFLFAFIVPTFANMLGRLNVPLPLMTQVIFAAGAMAQQSWWIVLLAAAALVAGVRVGRRWSTTFAREWDRLKLKLPLFGPLNHMLALSRFANNLAITYRAGIPILSALDLCRELVGNLLVAEAVVQVRDAVEAGSTLTEAVQAAAVFPPLVLRMIVVGESTGNLDSALDEVANYYNETVPERAKKMLTYLEPALIVLLIGVVLVVALAVYLPILTLVGSIR